MKSKLSFFAVSLSLGFAQSQPSFGSQGCDGNPAFEAYFGSANKYCQTPVGENVEAAMLLESRQRMIEQDREYEARLRQAQIQQERNMQNSVLATEQNANRVQAQIANETQQNSVRAEREAYSVRSQYAKLTIWHCSVSEFNSTYNLSTLATSEDNAIKQITAQMGAGSNYWNPISVNCFQ